MACPVVPGIAPRPGPPCAARCVIETTPMLPCDGMGRGKSRVKYAKAVGAEAMTRVRCPCCPATIARLWSNPIDLGPGPVWDGLVYGKIERTADGRLTAMVCQGCEVRHPVTDVYLDALARAGGERILGSGVSKP